MELRIVKLYTLLDMNVMPWYWDFDHYADENQDMIGFFYPEDSNALVQIKELEAIGAKRRESKK